MTSSQERKLGGCESPHLSHPLPSRNRIKPTHPHYDAYFIEFIKSKIVVDANGCWIWQGFKQWTGYGSVGYRGNSWPVHRAFWTALNGPVPDDLDVCHTCDVRLCCNDAHLWLGTRSENLLDMVEKRRGPCGEKAAQTSCIHGHQLTPDNVRLTNGGRRRTCLKCEYIRTHGPKYIEWRRKYQRKRRAMKRAAIAELRS